jgi:hypothetical protein
LNNYHGGYLVLEIAENSNLAMRITWEIAVVPCLAMQEMMRFEIIAKFIQTPIHVMLLIDVQHFFTVSPSSPFSLPHLTTTIHDEAAPTMRSHN